jgi:hypothetical protein
METFLIVFILEISLFEAIAIGSKLLAQPLIKKFYDSENPVL